MRGQKAGQGMVEFALSFGVLMFVVIATAQVAILIHYGTSLDVASREGAFQAALAGHGASDGQQATRQLWVKLEPGAAPLSVVASRSGRLAVVVASASAPALIPIPVPPFTHFQLTSRAAHTVETFQSGSR